MMRLPWNRARDALKVGFIALLTAVLLTSMLPTAKGATFTGRTDALVNPEQVTRDASSAIPVVGFNMTSTGGEILQTIAVEFVDVNGFDPGDDKDLRRLDVDSGKSGVGLFRDDGSIDDVLDAGDTAVVLSDAGWAGSRVDMDLTLASEPVPTSVVGLYHWFIIIRTADVVDSLDEGDAFRVLMAANSIVATDGGGTISQPAADVLSSLLVVRLTTGVNMIGGDAWIGPGDVAVNSMAVHGLRVVDGGGGTNYGIDDRIVELRVRLIEENGILTSGDLQPLDPDGSVSGLALYWDDGPAHDAWDPADTPIVLADISPRTFLFGGTEFTLTPQAPGLPVPDGPMGALDLFLVVRTRDIVTGDEFRLRVDDRAVRIDGTLAAQGGSVDSGLRTPLDTGATTPPSGVVQADSTPPRMQNEAWDENSPYLFARGLDLLFGNFMPGPEPTSASGEARDDESGLALATFSPETGLAGSPLDQLLTGSGVWMEYGGDYLFNATSTDTGSPAIVTIFDMVGNNVSSSDTGQLYRYAFVSSPLLILPDPGWTAPGGTPTWVDGNGKLWFSRLIQGTVTVDLTVDLVALSGAGLKNATASGEASLAGGPRPGSVTYAPVRDEDVWTNSYDIAASSDGTASPVTIWVEDNLAGSASASFEYGLDTSSPAITFLSPGAFETLTGEVEVRATVLEAETAVRSVQMAVDPTGTLQEMFFDGQAYFLPISTALFADGGHRLIIRAEDMVGNVHSEGLDVFFDNAMDNLPPVIQVSFPLDNAYVSGVISINATATDAFLATFEYAVDAGPWANVSAPLDTTQLADGPHALALRAVDAGGLTSTSELTIRVDNADPVVVFVTPPEGSSVKGLAIVQVYASDASGISSVGLDIGGEVVTAAFNQQTGYYEYALDSTLLPDGEQTVSASVTDNSGRTAEATMSFRIANEVPIGTRVLETLQANALLILIVLLVVLFLLGVRLMRRSGA